MFSSILLMSHNGFEEHKALRSFENVGSPWATCAKDIRSLQGQSLNLRVKGS